MIVRFTVTARADIEEIGDYIALDDPDRAVSFVVELRQACMELANSPTRYPLDRGRGAAGVRRRLYKNYLIFFRVKGGEIRISRVVHGARNYQAIDFPV